MIANPATDRQRRYIGRLLDERNVANPPDPNDPRLSKEAASELIDELLTIIPTRRGERQLGGTHPPLVTERGAQLAVLGVELRSLSAA